MNIPLAPNSRRRRPSGHIACEDGPQRQLGTTGPPDKSTPRHGRANSYRGSFGSDYKGPCEIRIASAEDGTVKTAFRSPDDNLIIDDWAPDGRSILCFVRKRDRTSSLAIISLDRGEIRQLMSFGWEHAQHARFSPDGEHIVFERAEGKKAPYIYVMDVEPTHLDRLTNSVLGERKPVWLSNGYVLYTSNGILRAVQCENGNAIGEPILVRADWDDFGKRRTLPGQLLFRKYSMFNDIYELDVFDGTWSSPTQVTKSSESRSPAWSPKGEKIAFIDRVGHELKILSVADRKIIRRFNTELDYLQCVFWSPDGKTLAIGPGRGLQITLTEFC